MRAGFALAGALLLAGCVAGDRVTLLPAAQDRDVGAVAVLSEDGTETVLDTANQQARLSKGTPRVRQLDQTDPAYAALIADLPRGEATRAIAFGTAEFRLSDAQIAALQQWIASDEAAGERPGRQFVIRAYADSFGSEEDNLALSQRRAFEVAEQLRAAGIAVDPEDVVGMGEYAAQAELGDEVRSQKYRRVDVVIR